MKHFTNTKPTLFLSISQCLCNLPTIIYAILRSPLLSPVLEDKGRRLMMQHVLKSMPPQVYSAVLFCPCAHDRTGLFQAAYPSDMLSAVLLVACLPSSLRLGVEF